MKSVEYYIDGIVSFADKTVKKLSVYDVGVIKFICFTLGLIFASWFPNLTKKIKFVFFLFGIFMVFPVIVKTFKIFRQVF